MVTVDGSVSFYLFDIDDNLLFLPTRVYLWNAETRKEMPLSSAEYAKVQNDLGRTGQWASWAVGPETFRDFRDTPGATADQQPFVRDVRDAIARSTPWRGRTARCCTPATCGCAVSRRAPRATRRRV